MCIDNDPRPRTETPQAKIFIQGKNRPLYVTQDVTEIGLQINDPDRRVLDVTNLRNERTFIPVGNVVSVVEYLPKPVTPDTQPEAVQSPPIPPTATPYPDLGVTQPDPE